MIRRIIFPLISLLLTVIPATIFLLWTTETGSAYLLQFILSQMGFETQNIRGTLYEGNILIGNAKSSSISVDNASIEFMMQHNAPFFKVTDIEAKAAHINVFADDTSPTAYPAMDTLPSIRVKTLTLEVLEHKLLRLEDIAITSSSRHFKVTGSWDKKPISLKFENISSSARQYKMAITVTHGDVKHHFTGINSRERLHLQSDPSEKGHVTIWNDHQRKNWNIDVNYELILDSQSAISSRFWAVISPENIALHLDDITVKSLTNAFNAHGSVSITPNTTSIDLVANDPKNNISIKGACTNNCDIVGKINLPTLGRFSNYLAGDLSGSLHITGSPSDPIINANLFSKHLRSSFIGADNLQSTIVLKPLSQDYRAEISSDSISFENNNIKTPWKLNLKTDTHSISGTLHGTNEFLLRGFIGEHIDLRIIPHRLSGDWKLNHDINVTYNTPTHRLNIHPICMQSPDINYCFNATFGRHDWQIDLSQIDIFTHIDTAIPRDSARHLYIKDIHVTGAMIITKDTQGNIQLQPNLSASLAGGTITNIVPGLLIGLNYHFDQAKFTSLPDKQVIKGLIESKQGPINLSLELTKEKHLLLNLSANNLLFQDGASQARVDHQLSCHIWGEKTTCNTMTDVHDSRLNPKQLTGHAGLPDDIFIDSPINIKYSAAYPINFMHTVILSKGNELSFAGFKGELTGQLDIAIPYAKPINTNGSLQLKAPIFSLFGHIIPLKKCSLEYSNSPLDAPILNLKAEKSTSANNQITKLSLSVFGRPDNLKFELLSSPPNMGQFEILQSFLSGKRNKLWKKEDDAAFLKLINQSQSSSKLILILEMISNLERSFQLDQFSIEPNLLTKDDLESSLKNGNSSLGKVTLGKEIAPNLSLRYQLQLNNDRSGQLSLVYQLPNNFLVQVYFNDTDNGINLLYQN